MSVPEARGVDFSQFRIPFDFRGYPVGSLKTGELLIEHSKLSDDPNTKMGIRKARESLGNGSLIVLDAHRTLIDIVFSLARLTQELPISECLAPYDAGLNNIPFFKSFLKHMGLRIDGLNIYPIVRVNDKKNTRSRVVKDLFDINFNPDEERALNRSYARRALKFVEEKNPQKVILLAPFAGVKSYRTKIDPGVMGILKKGIPILITMSVRKPVLRLDQIGANLDHTTYTPSQLLHFDDQCSDDYISLMIDSQFEFLERRIALS